MSELDRVKMQAELTQLLDKWLDKQIEKDSYSLEACPELARMMAVAALAVAEASAVAYSAARTEESEDYD